MCDDHQCAYVITGVQLVKGPQKVTVKEHGHPLSLLRGDSLYAGRGSWYCDKCRRASPEFVWHCTECAQSPGYDLCEHCVQDDTNVSPAAQVWFNCYIVGCSFGLL